jgi:phenylalanyl-tRNA synthetase beta chain
VLIRVPLSWLREYVDVSIPVDDLALRLHMSGTEVKGIERKSWKDIWVGRIAALDKHPNADKLQLATVEYGQGRRKQVVTGATNLSVGALVPYAELGAEYVDGHTGEKTVMKAKNMRGVTSEGMVLSEKELGLGEDHDGILLLPKNATVGAPLAETLGETVLLVELQPNRPDCVGIVGIAREVAALLDTKLREPKGDELRRDAPKDLDVRIEDPDACPRFAAVRLDGIRVGPSPDWMQQRLIAAGMRPISNVVDITNYVMLELGQPLHAYDLREIRRGTLVARQARPGERLRTLDSVERALPERTLVIADEERGLGIAGVMGGEDSEIRPDTITVALECASFEPRGIGRTATRLEMRGSSGSAAARRFAWELSPDLVPLALARAVALLREHAGARYAGIVDRYPRPRQQPEVRLPFAKIAKHLGIEVSREDAVRSLERLGFAVKVDGDALVAKTPAVRTDVAIPEDLIEEIARTIGYDKLATRMPSGPLPVPEAHPLEALRERVRDVLVGFGLQDTISYSVIDPAWLKRLAADGSCIAPEPLRITNPTTVAQSVMRPTLRASLFDTASRNLRHRSGVAIFEIAPAYLPRAKDLPEERWTIGILLAGQAEPVREAETWLTKERRYDLHDLRGIVVALRQGVRAPVAVTPERGATGLHPGRSWHVDIDGRTVRLGGQLDPRVAAMWELPDETFIAEIDLAHLLSETPARPAAMVPPRYPSAIRDLAIVVDEACPYAEVARAITEAAKGVVESVSLRDVYRGAQAGEGKKSFAVRVVLRSAAGTLSEEDVEKALRRIQGRLERGLGAVLRS